MARVELSEGTKTLIARHAAVPGTQVGTAALTGMKKMSNADPNEAIWREGDEFTVPARELLAEATIVAKINGNDAPAIAVDCKSGESKMLYLSSLKKSVVLYEETEDGYQTKKDAAGSTEVRTADNHYPAGSFNKIRKEVMGKATIGDIADSLAGRKFKVVKILGPFQTSRLKAEYDERGNRSYSVVGLRNTTIPVFEEV